MPYVDPSIIQGFQPIEIPDQGNMLMKALQIQHLKQQTAAAQAQAEAHQNALQRALQLQQVNSSLAPTATLQDRAKALYGAGFADEATGMLKTGAEIDNKTAQTGQYGANTNKINQDVEHQQIVQTAGLLGEAAKHGPQAVMDTLMKSPTIPEAKRAALIAQAQANPVAFATQFAQGALTPDQQAQIAQHQAQLVESTRHNRSTEGIAGAHLALSRAAEQRSASAPKGVLVQTENGPVFADPRTGQSVPVVDNTGAPIVPKATGKNLPQYVVEGIAKNSQTIAAIDKATTLLSTRDGKSSVGPVMGHLPQAAVNLVNPEGIDTRALIANIGSMQIKNRSGATVTAAEEPRLLPFIPLPTDRPDTVVKKLAQLKQQIQAESDGLTEFFPTAGKTAATLNSKNAASYGSGRPSDIDALVQKYTKPR